MLIVLLIVAALLAIVFGRKTAQGFLGGAFFLVGAFILIFFGLGVALYVHDQREESSRPPVSLVQTPAPSAYPTASERISAPPRGVSKITPEQERLFREVNAEAKKDDGPKTNAEWDKALAPYAGQ